MEFRRWWSESRRWWDAEVNGTEHLSIRVATDGKGEVVGGKDERLLSVGAHVTSWRFEEILVGCREASIEGILT